MDRAAISAAISDAILDLLWSAWTELGVPGVERTHQRFAIDPDPLIVFTPALAKDDPRLVEQAAAWCGRHGAFVSKTRLDGIARRGADDVRAAFEDFTARLDGAASDWARDKGRLRTSTAVRTSPPPLDRPALARLRMRALAGVGARADVLCELLGASQTWTSATDLERLGYTRRSLARVLADLAAARITSEKPGKGPASFRLREAGPLATVVSAEDLAWPDWAAILELAWRLGALAQTAPSSPSLALVKARDVWDDLRRLSLASGLREPPLPSGAPSAVTDLLRWGTAALQAWSTPAATAHRSSG